MSRTPVRRISGRFLGAADRWQRQNKLAGVAWAVARKFSEDNLKLFAVGLGWFGFTAIYPLLLVVVAVFGFIGAGALGRDVVTTLHQFPVIGDQVNPQGRSSLHGSTLGLLVGVGGLLYGAQGVMQIAEQAMSRVWNRPLVQAPGFTSRLTRSFCALGCIGGAFLMNAALGALAAGQGQRLVIRLSLITLMAVINVALYVTTFRILTTADVGVRQLAPGGVIGAAAFTILITGGVGLVQHQLRHAGAIYGALAAVIGVVTFLLLLANFSLYAAELNVVLARRLWPRGLPGTPLTDADEAALRARVHEEQRRLDQRIGVGFGPGAVEEAARDARRTPHRPSEPTPRA